VKKLGGEVKANHSFKQYFKGFFKERVRKVKVNEKRN